MKKCWKVSQVVASAAVLSTSSAIHAQTKGDNVISIGWTHIAPQSGSDPLRVTSVGGAPVNEVISGSSAGVRSSDTVGVTFEHYFTNQIGMALIGAWPGMVQLEGRGALDSFGVLGKARAWAPEIVMRYHFGDPQSHWRPFVGLGVSYLWFTNVQVTNSDFVKQNFGPGGSASASASSSLDPAFHVGFDYRINKRWAIGTTLIYFPAATKITVSGRTASGTEIVSETKVRLRPIVTQLHVSYTF